MYFDALIDRYIPVDAVRTFVPLFSWRYGGNGALSKQHWHQKEPMRATVSQVTAVLQSISIEHQSVLYPRTTSARLEMSCISIFASCYVP